MARPRAAIVGSVDGSRTFDPPLTDATHARRACEQLGSQLAASGWDIVVYSAQTEFAEADVVRGYVESDEASPHSIHLHAPIGKSNFAEFDDHPDLFDMRPDPSGDWEVAFFRSLFGCDGVILLGGGRSTLVAGLIAIALRVPLMAVAAFGGNARKVWKRLSSETGHSEDDIAQMGKPWVSGSAAILIRILDRQRNEQQERTKTAARHEAIESRRAQTSLAIAGVLILAAVGGLVFSWGWKPGPGLSIALLAVVPVLSAAGGALLRTSLDGGSGWARAGVLGGAAGLITGLLYVASQLVGTPDILDKDQADAVRRLLLFVLPIGFVAGLTFDAVYAKLRGADVSQVAALDKL